MANYAFLSYSTYYEVFNNCGDHLVGSLSCKTACFRDAFHSLDSEFDSYLRIYKIRLNKRSPFEEEDPNDGNNCLLDVHEVSEWLLSIQNIVPFDFKINEEDDRYILTIKLEGGKAFHKFVLTWVRYMYEGAWCCAVKETLKLKTLPDFESINTWDLMNIVCFANKIEDIIHQLGNPDRVYRATNPEQLNKRLESGVSMNNIFGDSIFLQAAPRVPVDIQIKKSENLIDEKLLSDRIDTVYKPLYKSILKHG